MTNSSFPTLVVCTTPRSGSNFLSSWILQSWSFGWNGEWLNPPFEAQFKRQHGLDPDLPLMDYIPHLKHHRSTPGKGWSIKLMWEHWLWARKRWMEENQPPESPTDKHILTSLFGNFRIVYLYRKDKTAQAVSLTKARQSGVWRQFTGDEHDPECPVSFQFFEIQDALEEIRLAEDAWEDLFQKTNISPHCLAYEDFKKAPRDSLKSIFSYLQVPFPDKSFDQTRANKAQRDRINETWIRQYRQRLEDTTRLVDRVNPWSESAFNVEWTVTDPVLEGKPGVVKTLPLNLTNRSEKVWDYVGRAEYNLSPVINAWVRPHGGESEDDSHVGLTHLNETLLPRESTQAFLRIHLPQRPGLYTLKLDFTQLDHPYEYRSNPLELPLWVRPSQRALDALRVFPEIQMENDERGHLPWFGGVDLSRFPWIRHDRHEWLHYLGNTAGDLWFFYPGLGTVFTSATLYPRFGDPVTGNIFQFDPDHHPEKKFVIQSTGESKIIPFHGLPFPP